MQLNIFKWLLVILISNMDLNMPHYVMIYIEFRETKNENLTSVVAVDNLRKLLHNKSHAARYTIAAHVRTEEIIYK